MSVTGGEKEFDKHEYIRKYQEIFENARRARNETILHTCIYIYVYIYVYVHICTPIYFIVYVYI